MLIAIWGMAAAGVLFELLFRMRYKVLSLITYLAMGWMIVLLSSEMQARLPEEALALVVGGGLFYTFGVVFYAVKRIPFNHAIWHLFVLGGSACHFAAIGWYVVGASPAVA